MKNKKNLHILKSSSFLFPVIILICFFLVGLSIYDDYGASADEHIQIEGLHICWRDMMQKLDLPYPAEFDELPELNNFQNRYYGQAAMFPVVIIESLYHFSLDISEIIKIRHLWSFLCYITAAVLFSVMVQKNRKNQYLTSAALLLLILQPRLFGDIFYNDRDLMLITWMLITLFFFDQLVQKSSPIFIIPAGLALAITINTRIFGIVMLIFPAYVFLFIRSKRKVIIFFLITALIFMFLIYPLAWTNPIGIFPQLADHFLKHQRTNDTGFNARLLFMNQKYYEHETPWYYLPVYILISTPFTHLFFGTFGLFLFITDIIRKRLYVEEYQLSGMLLIFTGTILGVLLTKPVFYNGWRHFYFLSVPILLFAVRGFDFFLTSENKKIFFTGCFSVIFFTVVNIMWIVNAHPYQIIYLNPVVRRKAAGKFDRDYWLISTPECLYYLDKLVPEGEIQIYDLDAFIDYAKIGIEEKIRSRFRAEAWIQAEKPIPFIIYNYTNKQGNEKSIPGYFPIYHIERDGMKIAEIFQYDQNNLDISASKNTDADDEWITQTYSFDKDTFSRIELYECSSWDEIPYLFFSFSENGTDWNDVPVSFDSPNGLKFEYPMTGEKLRIRIPSQYKNWQCENVILRGE
jgi:hypothetical protein